MAKPIVGVVSSNKGNKTIVVTVQTRKTHPLYRKQYTVSKKFMAHDELNEAQPGDKVAIVETRPLSARKRFILQTILEKPELREDSLAVTKAEEPAKPVEEPKS
jgi:small subunit ribosomal protein S17